MATRPLQSADLAPLDSALLNRFLAELREDMVLVGGQALSFWLLRYDLLPDGATVTHDGDAIGRLEQAEAIAHALSATLLPSAKSQRTALVAQIRVPTASGRPANIDILHQLYATGGLRACVRFTEQVRRNSVLLEWRPGGFIRVMDPFDLLESRVHNAAGLVKSKGEHVITQAVWAVDVARRALLRLARADVGELSRPARLGQRLQWLYRFAHSQAGRCVLRDHGIEVLDAVDQPALREISGAHVRQLDRIAEAMQARSASPS